MNVLWQGERVSFPNHIEFNDRNIAADEEALADLERLGYMTTPVTLIDGEAVVGFDREKLEKLLGTAAGKGFD